MESLRFSIYKIVSSTNSDSFTVLPFQFGCLFFFSLPSFSDYDLHYVEKSGKSGHLCLVSDFRGIAFSFSPLSIILAMGL